jgi:hypothetical protein
VASERKGGKFDEVQVRRRFSKSHKDYLIASKVGKELRKLR